MVMLFKKGPVLDKLREIVKLTFEHARNLAYFVLIYKGVLAAGRYARLSVLPARAAGSAGVLPASGLPASRLDSLVAGAVGGYLVWANYSRVNYQIVLYLLSRIVVGLVMKLARQGVRPFALTNFKQAYPWLATGVWAIVMFLFEHHPSVVHPSLKASMDFLYHESNAWKSWRDFLPSPVLTATLLAMVYEKRHALGDLLSLRRKL